MKKSLIVVLVLTFLLSLLMGVTAFADKFTVVKVITDLSKFSDITDQKNPNGFIHTFNPECSSKAELATVDGKKLLKVTAIGGGNNYFHNRLGFAANPDFTQGSPDGARIYTKTGDTSFAITIRLDYANSETKVRSLFNFFNIYIADKDGNRVDFEQINDCQVVIPENFDGYIVVPFDGEYNLIEGDDPADLKLDAVYQFLIAMDPVDSDSFDGEVIYFGNIETVKIQKSTAAPSTPAPTTAAPTTEAPVTTEPADETTEPTATEVVTSAPADSTAPATATTAAPTETGGAGNGWVLPVIIAAVVIAGGITAFILIKKRAKNA